MTDYAELRRLAEAAITAYNAYVAHPDPLTSGFKLAVGHASDNVLDALLHELDGPTVLALLDAAERADRAVELLREQAQWVDPGGRIAAFLAEHSR